MKENTVPKEMRDVPNKKDVWVISKKGQLLLQMEYSGILPLIVRIDGLRIYGFPTKRYPQGRIPYLSALDVLDWHRKELPHTRDRVKIQERKDLILELEKILHEHDMKMGEFNKGNGN